MRRYRIGFWLLYVVGIWCCAGGTISTSSITQGLNYTDVVDWLQKQGTDGSHVFALTKGPDGWLYGTQSPHVTANVVSCGTVFKINPANGTFTTLHTFDNIGSDGLNHDGCKPVGGVGFGSGTVMYGTTARGGATCCTYDMNHNCVGGCGTLWSLNFDGTGFMKLHDEGTYLKGGVYVDGHEPASQMEYDGSDGMYFVALTGVGTVVNRWNITAQNITNLIILPMDTIGIGNSTPAIDGSGMLRGFTTNKSTDSTCWGSGSNGSACLTAYGGSANCPTMAGSGSACASGGFYELNPFLNPPQIIGSAAFPLHPVNYSDDNSSWQGPTYMPDGTTWAVMSTGPGSGNNNWGWIARFGSGGSSYQDLHDFVNVGSNGLEPICAPVVYYDGVVYGTTYGGGAGTDSLGRHISGTVWRINGDGTGFTDFYDFPYTGDPGRNPYMGLTVGSDNYLYGATYESSAYGQGAIYRLHGCDDLRCF